MFCIGLTGNIASGKSTAIAHFKSLKIDVISADLIARQLSAKNTPAYQAIRHYFGQEILNSDLELNRGLLRQLIFADEKKRIWLEDLLHPLIREDIARQIKQTQSLYCVIEIPLLLSLKEYPYLDRVLAVLADENEQLKRLLQRDRGSLQDALAILKAQPSEQRRRDLADDLIINNGDMDTFTAAVENLHQDYLRLAKEKDSGLS